MAIILVIICAVSLGLGGGYSHIFGLLEASLASLAALSAILVRRNFLTSKNMRALTFPSLLITLVFLTGFFQYASRHALDREDVVVGLARLAGLTAFFLAAFLTQLKARSSSKMLTPVVWLGFLFSAGSLVGYFFHPFAFGALNGRLISSFPTSPNTAAVVMAIFAIAALGSLDRKSRHIRTGGRPGAYLEAIISTGWLELVTFCFSTIALALTGSRSGAFLLIASAIVFITWPFQRNQRQPKLPVAWTVLLVFVIGLVMSLGLSLTFQRLVSLNNDAVTRAMIYQAHWNQILRHPFFGQGLGSFSIINKSLVTDFNFEKITWIGDMHNAYLQWVEEVGLVGALPMFACLIWIVARISFPPAAQSKSTSLSKTAIAISFLLAAQNCIDISLQYEGVGLLWCAILGAAYASTVSDQRAGRPALAFGAGASVTT